MLPSAQSMARRAQGTTFRRFAWAFVAYLMFVILFGAWVRITHSGAGCGSHWPTCNGMILPLEPSLETIIEFSHRVTSGLLGIFGLIFVGWAALAFKRHRVTLVASVSLLFVILEGLVGAGLVLKELVADDDSIARAVIIAFHLVNTLVLTGAAALTAWWSTDAEQPRTPTVRGTAYWLLAASLLAIVVTSMTGAITALGDTLFPVQAGLDEGMLERLQAELSPAKHFLVRLRVVHPIVAMVAALLIHRTGAWVQDNSTGRLQKLARAMQHAVLLQVGIGLLNIALAAPGWMQLVHLLAAQIVWVVTVLAFVSARERGGPAA